MSHRNTFAAFQELQLRRRPLETVAVSASTDTQPRTNCYTGWAKVPADGKCERVRASEHPAGIYSDAEESGLLDARLVMAVLIDLIIDLIIGRSCRNSAAPLQCDALAVHHSTIAIL